MVEGITPSQLHAQMTKILADESGCPVTWEQHPAPLDAVELIRIWIRTAYLLGAQIEAAKAREDFAKEWLEVSRIDPVHSAN